MLSGSHVVLSIYTFYSYNLCCQLSISFSLLLEYYYMYFLKKFKIWTANKQFSKPYSEHGLELCNIIYTVIRFKNKRFMSHIQCASIVCEQHFLESYVALILTKYLLCFFFIAIIEASNPTYTIKSMLFSSS